MGNKHYKIRPLWSLQVACQLNTSWLFLNCALWGKAFLGWFALGWPLIKFASRKGGGPLSSSNNTSMAHYQTFPALFFYNTRRSMRTERTMCSEGKKWERSQILSFLTLCCSRETLLESKDVTLRSLSKGFKKVSLCPKQEVKNYFKKINFLLL